MSAGFWQTLSRRDPRRDLAGGLLALAVAAVWWGMRISEPAADPPPPAVAPPAEADRRSRPDPVAMPDQAVDPFASEILATAWRRAAAERAAARRLEDEMAARDWAADRGFWHYLMEPFDLHDGFPPPPEQAVLPEPQEPPELFGPPAPPVRRTVLYRGHLVRPDGSVWGLLEDQTAQKRVFVTVGDSFAGRRVHEVRRDALRLDPDDLGPLPLGTAVEIEEQRP